MKQLIKLLRYKQWVKNGFVFLPMFFGGRLGDPYCWFHAIIAFVSFSSLASSIYCINDIKDVEADRRHPKKCHRPIASGVVSIPTAWCMTFILVVFSFAFLIFLPASEAWKCASIGVSYLIMNILYCLWLKQYAIVDVFIISIGFVLRLVDGGLACDISLSPWIICMTFLLALFLAFAKRRDDLLINRSNPGAKPIRRSSAGYNMEFLNLTLGVLSSITVVCYLLYCVSDDTVNRFHTSYVYLTFIPVLAAVLRYLLLAVARGESGSPTKVFYSDRFIQVCILVWSLSFALIIYRV